MTLKSISTGASLRPKIKSKKLHQKSSTANTRERHSDYRRFSDLEDDELQSVRDSVCMSKHDDADINSLLISINGIKQDLVSMKADIVEIKAKQPTSQTQAPLAIDDFDSLAENISKIEDRVGDVKSLRSYISLLERRIKRIEDERGEFQAPRPPEPEHGPSQPPNEGRTRRFPARVESVLIRSGISTPKLPIPARAASIPKPNTQGASQPTKAHATDDSKQRSEPATSNRSSHLHAHLPTLANDSKATIEVVDEDGHKSPYLKDHEDVQFLGQNVRPTRKEANRQNSNPNPLQYSSKRRRIDSHVLSPPKPPGPSTSPAEAPETTPERLHTRPPTHARTLARKIPVGHLEPTNHAIVGRSSSRTKFFAPPDMNRPDQVIPQKSHARSQGPRDKEGYLLRPGGTRDKRSERFLRSGLNKEKKKKMNNNAKSATKRTAKSA